MNLTTFVDVAIGLSVMYLGASLLVTVANEYIAQVFELRSSQLRADLLKLIKDPAMRQALARNPALAPLLSAGGGLMHRLRIAFPFLPGAGGLQVAPSFVDPKMLAQLLVGALAASPTKGAADEVPVADRLNLDRIAADPALRDQLQALVNTAGKSMNDFVQEVGGYLDRTLVAMGEVYKRRLQMISLGVGLVVAVVFNLDTVLVTRHLYRDKEAREAVVAVGVQLVEKTDQKRFDECLKMDRETRRKATECAPIDGLVDAVANRNATLGQLPIGWVDANQALVALGLKAADPKAPAGPSPSARWGGLMLTALALSLGASFWFDLLNRFVNIRHGMRKPEAEAAADGGAAKG